MGLRQTERQFFTGYHPKTLHRQQAETHPVSLWRGLFTSPGALASGAGFKFATHPEAIELAAGNIAQGTPTLGSRLAFLQFTDTTQKGASTLMWKSNICNGCLGYTSRSPGLEASRIYHCGFIGPHIFANVEGCCLRVASNQFETMCWLRPLPLEYEQILAHSRQLGLIKIKSGCWDQ